ncbi:hypothetical protein GCM10027408_35120 [Microbacterium tumbae]
MVRVDACAVKDPCDFSSSSFTSPANSGRLVSGRIGNRFQANLLARACLAQWGIITSAQPLASFPRDHGSAPSVPDWNRFPFCADPTTLCSVRIDARDAEEDA